jgi:ribosomal protein S18 acetylase RimI-like enzyme
MVVGSADNPVMAPCDGLIGIRRAGDDDARGLAEVHIETWRAAYRGMIPAAYLASLSVAAREGTWRERFRVLPADRRPWVATDKDEIVGFVVAGPEHLDDDTVNTDMGEVYAINVSPGCWSRGVGRNLLARAERDLREHGYPAAILWCLADNFRARAFYERHGWQFEGTTKTREFGGTDVEEVRYRKALDKAPLGSLG